MSVFITGLLIFVRCSSRPRAPGGTNAHRRRGAASSRQATCTTSCGWSIRRRSWRCWPSGSLRPATSTGSTAVVVIGVVVFVAAKIIKWSAILALGRRWTFRVIVVPGDTLVASGPYRYFRHPNYVGVIGELRGRRADDARAGGWADRRPRVRRPPSKTHRRRRARPPSAKMTVAGLKTCATPCATPVVVAQDFSPA